MLGDEPRPPGLRRRILIVEDNELNLKLLADLLEFQGYDLVITGLGETAIEIVRDQQPDLILLDIHLPDIPGTEVARRLKADQRTREIPIIAVTAFAMQGDRGNILRSGCDEYVPKPIKLPEFLELVGRYLGNSRGRAAEMADQRRRRNLRQSSSGRRFGERRVRQTPWNEFERRSCRDRRQPEDRRSADPHAAG